MQPIVMSTTYGEREAETTLCNAWEILGGLPCSGLCGYVEDLVEFKQNKDYTLIIDYAHNEASLKNLLESLRTYHPNRILCMFGCGGNRSAVRRSAMGRVSSELADLTIITQDNSRDEPFEQILADILLGVTGDYVVIRDRKEAIGYCMRQMRPGDLLVLVGKGHEDTQEIAGKVEAFSERDIVESIEKTKKG